MKTMAIKNTVNESLSGGHKTPKPVQTPVSTLTSLPIAIPYIQRKPLCACDGGCPSCTGVIQPKLTIGQPNDKYEQEEEPAQAKSLANKSPPIANSIQQRIQSIKGSGRPLSHSIRAFFEPRFGQDFSDVRVYTGARAADAAKSLNARAFTLGKDIVFGSGQYFPQTSAGNRLLAHELTHTIQQGVGSKGDPVVIRRLPIPEQSIGSYGSSPHPSSPAHHRTGLPRGPNPAVCMERVCDYLDRQSVPANHSLMINLIRRWQRHSQACVRQGAASSNASHHADIQQNNLDELREWADAMVGDVQGQQLSYLMNNLRDVCRLKQREAELEFFHNIIFENHPTQAAYWGAPLPPWDEVSRALAQLPNDALWASPRVIRFHREIEHPDLPDVGGETDLDTGEIVIYDYGLGSQPYPRSRSIGIPSTTQTLIHEVGHVVMDRIPVAEIVRFFEEIIHWYEDYWFRLTPHAPEIPQPHRRRLERIRRLTGDQLDSWLSSLDVDLPVEENGYTFIKRHDRLSNHDILQYYETMRVPDTEVFERARVSREEYLAELYALAITRPRFLHTQIRPDQVVWLKRVVFRTPANLVALAAELAMDARLSQPIMSEFVNQGRWLFTWRQLEDLWRRLMPLAVQGGRGVA